MRNTMVLFGCGGAGTNIVTPYVMNQLKDKEGHADIEAFIVDTSESNIKFDQVRDHFYKIKLEDKFEGSGGVRSQNFQEIQAQTKSILLARKPGDINVLVASGSGGSGGTIATVLARELIAMGKPTILILVVDDNSLIAAENSLKSLATIDNLAKQANIPFIVYPVPNTSISEANAEIQKRISNISVLFSNENFGLDNSDTANFLNYTRVTNAQPGIASLVITDKLGDEYNRNPITLAMIHTNEKMQEEARGKFVTAYSTEGILRNAPENLDKTIYFWTEFDDITSISNALRKQIEEYQSQISGASAATASIKTNAETTSGGFVF